MTTRNRWRSLGGFSRAGYPAFAAALLGFGLQLASAAAQSAAAEPATPPAATAPAPSPGAQPAPAANPPQPPASGTGEARPEPPARMPFRDYLRLVGEGNLELIAERSSISLARAEIELAKIFPDPQLTAGLFQYDLTQKGGPTASVVQLAVPLQIGGQRGARVAFAEANLAATTSDLAEFLRGLRARAAGAYVDALHAELVLERRRQSLASLERLVVVNEERHRVGDVGEAAVLQSRVEANQFRAAVLDAEGQVRTTHLAMIELLGKGAPSRMGRPIALGGDLRTAGDRQFDRAALVKQALQRRPDLVAARQRVEAANRQLELARANRVIDIALGASWQHNFPGRFGGPMLLPASDFLGGTVTVPLPFSRLYRGELDAAHATRVQADALALGVEIRVESEVRQAVAKYEAAAARVRLYTQGVLQDADSVLEMTLYNYQRGGATLVEVLVSYRTDNEVHLSYYDSLVDAAHALIEVEQASGSWDIDF